MSCVKTKYANEDYKMARIIDGNNKNLIGANLKKLRTKMKISQQELSNKLELLGVYVCRGSVSRIEDCSRTVTDIELFAIAEVLNFAIPVLTTQKVNMYFISKGMDLDMPILSHVKRAFPYWVFVGMYALVYTEIAIGVAYLFYKLANRKKKY